MNARKDPVRVAVWSTGGIGSLAIHAISRRPSLDLVGVWVHAPEKVDRDAGELAGGPANGVVATNDAQALIDLHPACIVYAASGPDRDAAAVPDYVRFLEAGINVVTATSTKLVFPPAFDPTWYEQLAAAARSGGASLYASGIWPGLVPDHLPIFLTTQCGTVRSIRAAEVELFAHYPVAFMMMDAMGFGMPLDFVPWIARPGFLEAAWAPAIHYMAHALGVEVEEIRATYDRRPTDRTLEVACGTIATGTCGAIRTEVIGVVAGRDVLVVEHVARMARDLAPEWPHDVEHDASLRVHIDGEPEVECTMIVGGRDNTAGGGTMMSTAMRVVNAIPYVVDAEPGLLSSLDLPLTVPHDAVGP